jgi:hypothetical protein
MGDSGSDSAEVPENNNRDGDGDWMWIAQEVELR